MTATTQLYCYYILLLYTPLIYSPVTATNHGPVMLTDVPDRADKLLMLTHQRRRGRTGLTRHCRTVLSPATMVLGQSD